MMFVCGTPCTLAYLGDDRRMNMLLKNIIKFANSEEEDEKIIEVGGDIVVL